MLVRGGHWCGNTNLGVPGENPLVQVGDHHTLLHTTTVDQRNRTRVTEVINKGIVHCATQTPSICLLI